MPTYEYICTSCSNEWEFEQSIKEDAIKECPKCKNDTAQRQISRGAGFILKGGGWYADLYSSSSNKSSDPKQSSSTGEKTSPTPPPSTTPASPANSTPSTGESSSGNNRE